jgi:hypothetical protein
MLPYSTRLCCNFVQRDLGERKREDERDLGVRTAREADAPRTARMEAVRAPHTASAPPNKEQH